MQKFLRSNKFAMILAFFLAVILWLFVVGDNITRTTLTRKVIQGVPLIYENLADNHLVVEMPATVDVTLEGLPGVFEGLTVNEGELYVDLEGKREGRHQLRVRERLPRGIELISIFPEQVFVAIEALVEDRFAVQVELGGEPAAEWRLRLPPQSNPDKLLVKASRSVLDQVSRVVVLADISGARDLYRQELTPIVLDDQGRELAVVEINPDQVIVTVFFDRIDQTPPE